MKTFNNKSILITGGTGSFGNQFVKECLNKFSVKKLVIFSRDELKQYEMQKMYPENKFPQLRFHIGDIRDYDRLLLATREIDIIVHAAALKQVVAAEYNPIEFIKTNIIGAENIIKASINNNVKKIIALSTDKAVNPINLYGATKLVSDKLFLSANNISGNQKIAFSLVRYGNVLNSRGSILPVLKNNLSKKKKFQITDERMTRFFITLSQGVNFVFKSAEMMVGGEIFVPKIPSIKITDLAKAVSKSNGYEIIGIRPGEKIHEDLISSDNSYYIYEEKNFYILIPKSISTKRNYKKYQKNKFFKLLKSDFEYSSNSNTRFLNIEEIKKFIKL